MEIGFSQRVRLEWLEETARLVALGSTAAEIRSRLGDLLRDQISIGGEAERGNRKKAISILIRVWATPTAELRPLRDEGLALLRRLHGPDRLVVHWGMCMAAYPFFGAVAETVGRLLRLQDTVTAAQAQRRIRERLGERETVARAARRILRCFHDWGVLEETGRKGVYRGTPARRVGDLSLSAWLVEAVLIAGGANPAPLRALRGTPALFPFDLQPVRAGQLNGRLEVFRQGLDEEVVTLKRSG